MQLYFSTTFIFIGRCFEVDKELSQDMSMYLMHGKLIIVKSLMQLRTKVMMRNGKLIEAGKSFSVETS